MTPPKIPTKLMKDPIVDVVFEMRFSSSTAAAGILPGFFFAKLNPIEWRIETLPLADIPNQVRSNDPNLRFQPIMRIHWDNFLLLVGDRVIGICCKMPYPGWGAFKERIIKIAEILSDSNIIKHIERYSLKYANVLEGEFSSDQIKRVNIDLRVGSRTITNETINVRVEISNNDFMTRIQFVTDVTVQMIDGKERKGSLVDIDTLCDYKTSDISAFTKELPNRLDAIHIVNEETFFDCLRKETIDSLDPVYE